MTFRSLQTWTKTRDQLFVVSDIQKVNMKNVSLEAYSTEDLQRMIQKRQEMSISDVEWWETPANDCTVGCLEKLIYKTLQWLVLIQLL